MYTNAKSSVFTEQNDRRGNSREKLQALAMDIISVRNMLSTQEVK